MSTRALMARLAKLPTPPAAGGPVCRWHDQACGMGRNWPLPYVPDPSDELCEFVEGARRRVGKEPRPTRRERWAHQDHEQVPQAELDREARDLADLVARHEARNAEILAEMTARREEQP